MSKDRPIDDSAADASERKARQTLSEHALDGRNLAARDQISRVSDTGEKSFREQCVDALKAMRGELRSASAEMTQVNKDVESGKLQVGSEAWQKRMESAAGKYDVAVQNADKRLTPENLKLIAQEQQVIAQEIQLLDAARKAGRPLSQQEMQKLGLRSNDPVRALEERQQQAMVLEDLARSSGYARANFGLAMIRASAGMDQQSQAQLIEKGQKLLNDASQKDPKMFGPPADPNFEKHFKRVVKIATGQDVDLSASQDSPDGLPNRNAKVVEANGRRILQDGSYRLPTGDAATDGAQFKNPFTILRATEESLKQPLTQDNVNGFKAAIEAADSIDRVRLGQKIASEKDYIDRVLSSENGVRIKSIMQQMDQSNQQMDKQHETMASMIPGIVQGADGKQNPAAVQMLEKLRNFGTIDELEGYLRDPKNANEVNAFRNLPKGAEFISTLEQFKNNQKILDQGQAEIAKYDPQFAKAQEDLQKDLALYHSSEDTRAHFIRALVQSNSPEAKPLAQQYIGELAQIKPALMNDPEFAQMAQFAGMQPDGKGGLEVAKPGTTTGATTLDQNSMQSIANAYAAFQSVKDGTPLTPDQKAVFEQSVAAAAKINPQEVRALREQAKQEFAKVGWNDQLEQQFTTLNQAVNEKFSKIPQDKQAQINDIQNKIGALQSTDATAQQQRQNLEGQLQGMGSDPAVKAWLDSRVALANFYSDAKTGPAVQARIEYQRADQNLAALEHAKALTEGLYGAALVKSGDKAGAREHLIAGAADQAALQMAPEIANAIQQTGDQTILQEAAKRASDTTATGDNTNLAQQAQQFDAAAASLKSAGEALAKAQANGQPLPQDLRTVFESAIAANSSLDKNALAAMDQQMQQRLLNGWTQQDEANYQKVTQELAAAEQGISPDAQKKVQEQLTALANDPQGQQKLDQFLRQLATTDQTVANYVQKSDAATTYHQDPKVQARDQYAAGSQQLAYLAHGKGIAEAMYAQALLTTGNQQDAAKAKEVLQSALQDKELVQVEPRVAELAAKAGLGDQAVTQNPQATDPQLAKIPGFTQLMQAEQIMQDQSLSPQERIKRAGPLYDQAIEESKKINITKLDQDLTAIGTKMKEILEGAEKVKNDPAALQKYQQEKGAEYQQLQNDAQMLTNMRLEPLNARLKSAQAHNAAAAELYAQAEKDPAKKEELTRTADEMNRKAAATLRSVEQADPRMWNETPSIKGAIEQAEQHKKIEMGSANAIGQVVNTQKIVDFGVNGPFKGFQPVWMSMNAAGEVLGPVPVVGIFAGGLSRTEETRPGAALALAMAMDKDQGAANDMVNSIQHNLLNQGTHVVSDIASGYAGVTLGRVAVNMVGNRFGPLGKAATFIGAGFLGTTATNAGLDWTASKVLGTDQRDTGELLSHSAASFGMTWGLQGLANYRQASTANFLAGVEGKASLGQSMAVWNEQKFASNLVTAPFKGTQIEVPSTLKEQWRGLSNQGKTAVGDALTSKYTAEQFAALNSTQQYSAFLKAYNTAARTTAAELSGGSKLMSRLPFSGNMAEARAALGEVQTPWMFSTKGKLAWNAGTGAASMGVYGLGEVNPFLTNKQTGEHYTLGETLGHAGTNMAWGGFGSAIAAPLVGKAMDFTVKKPLEFVIGKPIAWAFNSEAATLAKPWSGLSQAESKTAAEVAQGFNGFWRMSGDGALTAARNRFVVGFGGGGGMGMLTHNPWMINPDTGKNYTWAETGSYGLKWGTIAGGGLTAAPYAMFGGKMLVEKAGKPVYNWTVVPAVNNTAKPLYNAGQPMITKLRVGLGTASDKVIKNPAIVSAYERVTTSAPAQYAQAGWNRYAAVSLGPTAMLEGQAAGDLYAYREWDRVKREADAILKAHRDEQAKKQQQPARS